MKERHQIIAQILPSTTYNLKFTKEMSLLPKSAVFFWMFFAYDRLQLFNPSKMSLMFLNRHVPLTSINQSGSFSRVFTTFIQVVLSYIWREEPWKCFKKLNNGTIIISNLWWDAANVEGILTSAWSNSKLFQFIGGFIKE